MRATATDRIADRLLRRWPTGRPGDAVRFARETVRRDAEAGGELLAGALAMRLFLLLLPFVAALVAGLGLLTSADPETAREVLEGVGITSVAADSVTRSARISTESMWIVLTSALTALVLASRTTARALWIVHGLAWGEAPRRPPRPWRGALAVIGFLLVLVGAALVGPVLGEALGLGLGLLGVAVTFAVTGAVWLAATWLLPHGGAPLQALVPGALLIATGTTVLHLGAVLLAAGVISHYNEAYGALGGAVAGLLWLYVVGRLIVAGAMLDATRWACGPGGR